MGKRRCIAAVVALALASGCGQKAGVHQTSAGAGAPLAAPVESVVDRSGADLADDAVDIDAPATDARSSAAASPVEPNRPPATSGASAGGFAAVVLAASRVTGTERTSGDDEDPETYRVTRVLTKASGTRFRLEELDEEGEPHDGGTVATSARGLELVSIDFEDHDDCVWSTPIVLVPAGAAASGTSSCTVTFEGDAEEGIEDEQFTLKLDWAVKRLADGTRRTKDGERRVANVETNVKVADGEGSGSTTEQASYDLANGQLLDRVETATAEFGEERFTSRREFHAH